MQIKYPDEMGSKFEFITVASLRCRQLQKGAKPRVSSRSKKFTTIAQEEVLSGIVPHAQGPQPPATGVEGLEPAGAAERDAEK